MNFNHRGNPQVYGTSCSTFGCLIGAILLITILQGGLYFLFRYFWVIVFISIIIWLFRTLFNNNDTRGDTTSNSKNNNWHREFESRDDTSYHNIDREFEEVDEEDDNSFDDF